MLQYVVYTHETISNDQATSLTSTRSRNTHSLVSRSKNSNWNVDLIWICTEEFEFLNFLDFGSVAFSDDSSNKTYHQFRKLDVMHVQPIVDRAAQNLEIDSREFQFSIWRTRIPMRFMISIIYYVVLIANPMGRIVVRLKCFRNNLEILCHPICN